MNALSAAEGIAAAASYSWRMITSLMESCQDSAVVSRSTCLFFYSSIARHHCGITTLKRAVMASYFKPTIRQQQQHVLQQGQ